MIVLNSNCPFVGGCQAGLAAGGLAASRSRGASDQVHGRVLASPSFSTGVVGDSPDIRPLFQALYDGNADLLLVGHAHNYQRWSPLNPTGAPTRPGGSGSSSSAPAAAPCTRSRRQTPARRSPTTTRSAFCASSSAPGLSPGSSSRLPVEPSPTPARRPATSQNARSMRALIVEDGWQRGALAATRSLGRAGWDVGIGSPRPGFAAASRFAAAWHDGSAA